MISDLKTQLPKMLGNNRLSKNSLYSLVQGLIGVVAHFLILRLLIKHSGTEVVGLWSLTLGLVAFIRLVDVSGGAGLSRLVSMCVDNEKKKIEFIDTITLTLLIFYGAIALITFVPYTFAVERLAGEQLSALAKQLVPWALASLVIGALGNAQTNALDGYLRVDLRAKILIFGSGIFALTAIALIPTFGVVGFAIAQVFQNVIVLVVARSLLILSASGLRPWPHAYSMKVLKESFSYGLKLQASSFPLLIYEPLTRVVISQTSGLHALAVYDIAYKLCSYLRLVLQSATTPLIPEFARVQLTDVHAAKELFLRAFGLVAPLSLVLFCLLIVISPIVSIFVFSELSGSFIASIGALSLAFSVAAIGIVPTLFTRASGHMKWNIIGQWTISTITLALLGIISIDLVELNHTTLYVATALFAGYATTFIGNLKIMKVNNLIEILGGIRWLLIFEVFVSTAAIFFGLRL